VVRLYVAGAAAIWSQLGAGGTGKQKPEQHQCSDEESADAVCQASSPRGLSALCWSNRKNSKFTYSGLM